MKLKFIVNIDDDIWNWYGCVTTPFGFGINWLRFWPKDFPLKDGKKKEKIKAYLNKKYYKNKAIYKYAEWIKIAINPKVINETLKDVTGRNVPFKEVYVKITTYGRCPYDADGGGFFSLYGASREHFYRTAMHECMHLIIHKYYWKQMLDEGLTNDQAHDLKEALTVLLNQVFIENWNLPEKGYPNHQNLRKDIEKISKETKKFDALMTKVIKLYLEKYKKKVS